MTIYSSYDLESVVTHAQDIPVGTTIFYRCRNGLFDLYRNGSKYVDYIDITCKNHPDGITKASWDPYFHHIYASFPPCVESCKYLHIQNI